MPPTDSLAVRIAAAQLAGLSRVRRVVPAGPFVGLLAADGPAYLSYAVAARPGEPVHEVGDSLAALRAAFPPGALRFELLEQACPGAAEALAAAGMVVAARLPLMVLDPAAAAVPPTPDGVVVGIVDTAEDMAAATAVAGTAFGVPTTPPEGPPPPPEEGGGVLARIGGEAVAAASWTGVADGVTEIVGVATLAEHRRRGLGALVTAHAVRAAAERAGARLAWLTPGDEGAGRVYTSVGFARAGDAVHLAEAGRD